jgi:glycosyltransferase Alg8
LIYFGQIYGALVKTYIQFRLDRQRWTRQDMGMHRPLAPARARRQHLASTYLHLLALGALVVAVAFATNFLSLPQLAAAGGRF